MNTFGPNFQARIFPEGKKNDDFFYEKNFSIKNLILVVGCLFISMICCGLVHRVCVTTW